MLRAKARRRLLPLAHFILRGKNLICIGEPKLSEVVVHLHQRKSTLSNEDLSAAVKKAEAASQAADEYKFRKKGSRSPSDARLSSEEEFIWQPLGIGLIAEAKIQASIKQGQLNNLKGAGKPFKVEDHGAQFFQVDPTFQAMMRTLGAQNVRPESAALREELRAARKAFESRARELLARGTDSLEEDERLRFFFNKLKQKIEEYNGALLKDKETYPGWPLLPYPTSITLSGEVKSLK